MHSTLLIPSQMATVKHAQINRPQSSEYADIIFGAIHIHVFCVGLFAFSVKYASKYDRLNISQCVCGMAEIPLSDDSILPCAVFVV